MAIAAWQAEPRTTPGGQLHYPRLAITTAVTLRAVWRSGKRIVAVCSLGEEDLGAWLLSQELALADRRYSYAYLPEENERTLDPAGLWRNDFVPPWEWCRMHQTKTRQPQRFHGF